jgi:predicted negative regulator of RcsB-dependent stress response
MTYDLQEQEQVDALKAWWKTNGSRVSAAATAVLAAIVVYQGWSLYTARRSAEASAMYDQFDRATSAKEGAKAKELASSLTDRYGSTIYASLAALRAAKSSWDASDAAAAKAQLRWVIDHAAQPELALLARVRLAGVLLDEKAYDEALQTLKVKVPDAYASAFADRRGDVLMAQGKPAEARTAYVEALAKAGGQQPIRALIQLKLDALPAQAGA